MDFTQYTVLQEPNHNPELSQLFEPLTKMVQDQYDHWTTRPLCKTTKAVIELKNTLEAMKLWVNRDDAKRFSALCMRRMDAISPDALRQAFYRDKKGHIRANRHYKRLMKELADWLQIKTQ